MHYSDAVDVILLITLVSVLITKLVLFFRFRHETWKAHNLLYFSHYEIVLTRNAKKEKISRIQNSISVGALFIIALYILLKVIVFHNFPLMNYK